MIHLYRFFYLILKTLILVLRPFLNAQTQAWIQLRSSLQAPRYRNLRLQDTLWIHASSGEIEYAKPVIRELKKQSPALSIVVTYSSASAEKLFENIRAEVGLFMPLPWDDAHSVRQLIKKIRPRALVIARTDLWPEMISQCAHQHIPLGLISYFPRLDLLSRLYLKFLLPKFDFISYVTRDTEKPLKKILGGVKTFLTADGDTRFDQVFSRLDQPPRFSLQSEQKVFTFGSTWPEDEVELESLFDEILKNGQRIILSPHDVSEININRLCQQLDQKKHAYRKLSEFSTDIVFDFPILLIDRIGYLADAYRFSDFAFVGGSFKARVHSVMEPLCCGLPVLVGPFYQNNPEALKYAEPQAGEFVRVNQNAKQLVANYNNLLALPEANLTSLKNKIKNEMQKNQGASQKTARFILDSLLKKAGS